MTKERIARLEYAGELLASLTDLIANDARQDLLAQLRNMHLLLQIELAHVRTMDEPGSGAGKASPRSKG